MRKLFEEIEYRLFVPLREIGFAIRKVGGDVGCGLIDGFSFHINVDVHIFVGDIDVTVTEDVFDSENDFGLRGLRFAFIIGNRLNFCYAVRQLLVFPQS